MKRSGKETQEFADLPPGFPVTVDKKLKVVNLKEEEVDMDDGGVPDVPDVSVENPHWKVGDGMTTVHGKPDYVIGQIALVDKGLEGVDQRYDIVIFDTTGKERGRLHVIKR